MLENIAHKILGILENEEITKEQRLEIIAKSKAIFIKYSKSKSSKYIEKDLALRRNK